ncbi:MAG: hypothetical protein IKF99_00120 [Oscillospiraceae bacterium]|nr:hypothetical protein [Oscillospiraceae bacterium]
MSLFKKPQVVEQRFVEREVPPLPKPKKEKLVQIYTYQQNDTFKGHKSISLYVKNNPEALKNINALKVPNKNYVFDPATVQLPEDYSSSSYKVDKYFFPFKKRLIVLKEYLRDKETALDVFVNDYYVGSLPVQGDRQTELYQAIQNDTLESVHVRIEPEYHNTARTEKKKRIIETEEQFKVYLFYKLKEAKQ